MKMKYLHKRGHVFGHRRKVPPHLQAVVGQTEWVSSFRTTDINVALHKLAAENRRIDALIHSFSEGHSADNPDPAAVRELAHDLGLRAIAPSSIDFGQFDMEAVSEVVVAVLNNATTSGNWNRPSRTQVDALASTVKTDVLFSEVVKIYERLTRDRWTSKNSPREREKFYRPIYAAAAEFEKVVGPISVLTLRPKHVSTFRDHLVTAVENGHAKPNTANKKLMNLGKVVKAFFAVEFPDRKNPFDGFKLKDQDIGKRIPMTDPECSAISAHMETFGHHDQLSAIAMIAMDTGCTCKEICLLTRSDIHFDAEIPYIRIAENELRSQVKSGGARHRDIPLVGQALVWANRFPDGFPNYQRSNGSEAASAAINKRLKQFTNNTTYSFRHRLADKLRNSGCSDSLKDAIMGHTTPGMGSHYGSGYSLEVKRHALLTAFGLEENRNSEGLQ